PISCPLAPLARCAHRGAQLLSEMLSAPSMRDVDFQRVRQLRLDRLRQLTDLPPAVAERAFLRLLYPTHPYGHLAIGTDGALRSLTREEVVRFHAASVLPWRATLVVVGALPHADLVKIAEDAFGGWTDDQRVDGPLAAADSVVAMGSSPL